jgi:hypothetical protein
MLVSCNNFNVRRKVCPPRVDFCIYRPLYKLTRIVRCRIIGKAARNVGTQYGSGVCQALSCDHYARFSEVARDAHKRAFRSSRLFHCSICSHIRNLGTHSLLSTFYYERLANHCELRGFRGVRSHHNAFVTLDYSPDFWQLR